MVAAAAARVEHLVAHLEIQSLAGMVDLMAAAAAVEVLIVPADHQVLAPFA